VGRFLDTVYKTMEGSQGMARLEMKRYDEVVGAYRSAVYALRRLVLAGSDMQRKQVGRALAQGQWPRALQQRWRRWHGLEGLPPGPPPTRRHRCLPPRR
jgi:hypothetical protein